MDYFISAFKILGDFISSQISQNLITTNVYCLYYLDETGYDFEIIMDKICQMPTNAYCNNLLELTVSLIFLVFD